MVINKPSSDNNRLESNKNEESNVVEVGKNGRLPLRKKLQSENNQTPDKNINTTNQQDGELSTSKVAAANSKFGGKGNVEGIQSVKNTPEETNTVKVRSKGSKLNQKAAEESKIEEKNQQVDDPDATLSSSTAIEDSRNSQVQRRGIVAKFQRITHFVTKIRVSTKESLKKLKSCRNYRSDSNRRVVVIPPTPNTPPLLAGKSFGTFDSNHPLRNACAIFFSRELTRKWISGLIILQWFLVSIESFHSDARHNQFGQLWSDYILLLINFVYILEMLGKMIVYGCVVNPPPLGESEFDMQFDGVEDSSRHRNVFISHRAYLRNPLHKIDFIAIVSYWIDLILMFVLSNNRIYVFKLFSIIRPMGLVITLNSVSVIIESLKRSRPILINIVLFLTYFFFLFAILGLLLFEGRLDSRCVFPDTDKIAYPTKFCSSHYLNPERTHIQKLGGVSHENLAWTFGYTCAYGFECRHIENPMKGYLSFDNIFSSLLIIYQIATMQKWSRIMHWLMAGKSWTTSVFFILSVLILNFWLITLFVAVITRMFEKTQEDRSKMRIIIKKKNAEFQDVTKTDWNFISEEEKSIQDKSNSKWYHNENIRYLSVKMNWNEQQLKSLMIVRLFHKISGWGGKVAEKYNSFKQYVYTREWSLFTPYIRRIKQFGTLLILVDLIFKATSVDPASLLFYLFNAAITVALAIEIGIRFITKLTMHYHPGFQLDFEDWTDLFLGIVTLSICFIPFKVIYNAMEINYLIGFSILRSYRVVVKIQNIKKLLIIVTRRFDSIKMWVIFVVLSFLVVTPMGITLMGGTSTVNNKGEHFTFNNFGEATLALIQIFSAEDWGVLMYEYMSYCKNSIFAFFVACFMVIWSGFSTFVLINLFIAITMDGFQTAELERRTQQISNYIEQLSIDPDNIQQSENKMWKTIGYIKERYNAYRLELKAKSHDTLELTNEKDTTKKSTLYKKFKSMINFNFLSKSVKKNLRKKIHYIGNESISSKLSSIIQDKSVIRDEDAESQAMTMRSQTNPNETEVVSQEIHLGKTWFIFSSKNTIRLCCQKLSTPRSLEENNEVNQIVHQPAHQPFYKDAYRLFKYFMQLISWIAIIAALVDIPWYQKYHGKLWNQIFNLLEVCFLVIFSLEFLIKTIANGVIFEEDAYLRNVWNKLDFLVLLSIWVKVILLNFIGGADSNFINALKAFRVLRLVTGSEKIKKTIYSLFVAGSSGIIDVIILGAAFTIPYAIYGHLLFGKLLCSCNDKSVYGIKTCVGLYIDSETDILVSRVWNNPRLFNFDSFGSSFLILIEILSREKWIEVMQITMGIRGKNLQPEYGSSWGACFYFIGFFLLGSVFVLTMFITIVIQNFRNYTGVSLHTANQRRYTDLRKQINLVSPSKQPTTIPKSPFLNWCYNFTVKKTGGSIGFVNVLLCCLLILLMMHYFGNPPIYNYCLKCGQLGVLLLLFTEIPISLLGIGWKNFMSKRWNLVYFIGLNVTIILQLIWFFTGYSQSEYFAKIGQCALLLRLITTKDQLLQLVNIMAANIIEILNLLYLWFIVILIYAIAFNQVLGLTKYGYETNNFANFRYIWTSLLLLIRMSFGEFWNEVMHDFTWDSPYCVKGTTYLDSDCGNPIFSYIFFISFNIISLYIFTNMFIVLILDNFSFCYDIAASFSLLTRGEIRHFKRIWRLFDENGTGYLDTAHVIPFLKSLESPFDLKLYPRNLEIHHLLTQFNTEKSIDPNDFKPVIEDDKVDKPVMIYYGWVQKKLKNTFDHKYLHFHRRKFNLLYRELMEKNKKDYGIPMTDALLTLAHYKIVNREDSFLIQDLLDYYKEKDTLLFEYRVELAVGLMKTYLLKKKLLKRLNKLHGKHPSGSKEGSVSLSRAVSNQSSDESVVSDPLAYLNSFINENQLNEAELKDEKFDEEEPERLNTSGWNTMLSDCISIIQEIDFPSSSEDSSSDSGSFSDAYTDLEPDMDDSKAIDDQAYESDRNN